MYDPMILNMVSERYPRDEDYASDSDSDMITDEDFDFDVPPWLFQDLEDEDGSLIQKEHDHLNIVFGSFDSFDQDSDLETIAVAAPLISIQPECDEFTIQIGEILCSLSAVKQRNDGGSFEKVAATQSLDLESNTMDLQSNTTEEIKTGCIFDFASDCNNRSNDEARISKTKSTIVEEIAKKDIFVEMENASITMLDFILAANGKPDPANQLHEVFFQIVPSTSVFNNNDSAPRSSTNFIFEASIPVSFRWFDFDFSFTTLYLVHHALFAFGLATTASSLKKSTEHLLAGNATPRLTTFADPGGTLKEISYSAAELSFQSSGCEANMERRRKMKMGNSKPQLPPCKPPDPPLRELRGSCCWSSPWKMREEEDALLLLEAFSLLCVFVVHVGRVPLSPALGQNFGPSHLRPCLFGLG